MKCPNCDKYVSQVVATFNGADEIKRVEAECKKCGTVEPTDWEWDDFCNDIADADLVKDRYWNVDSEL
jgi:transcriptional regulator NrdR family protein